MAAVPSHTSASPVPADWSSIARSDRFVALVAAKRRFVIPASIFFILYYFALPVLVGYFPALMEHKVLGAINLAYLFALSQFFMAWIIMWLYIRAARRWDAMEHEIVQRFQHGHQAERAGNRVDDLFA